MACCTFALFPSAARIHSQGKTTFIARSVTRVAPNSGCAFLKRLDWMVKCQDQKSSGSTCSVCSSELANSEAEISCPHHRSNSETRFPLTDQPEASAKRRCG